MPLRWIKCKECLYQVPIEEAMDHFEECGSFPLPMLKNIVDKESEDYRHKHMQCTTTTANDCARAAVIKKTEDYAETIKSLMPATLGTVLHAKMAESKPNDKWITEDCTCVDPLPIPGEEKPAAPYDLVFVDGVWHEAKCGRAVCTFPGRIEGIEVSGLVDAIQCHSEDDSVTIYDWKFRSPYAYKYTTSDDPKDADVIQAAINAELARQNGWNVRAIEVAVFPWYDCVSFHFDPPPDISIIHDIGPGDSDAPAIEHLKVINEAYEKIKNGEDHINVIRSLPFHGESMYKDKRGPKTMCTKFCSVADKCAFIG